MTRRSGLGRGLAALIPPSPEEANDGSTDNHHADPPDADDRDADSPSGGVGAGDTEAGDTGAGNTRSGDTGAADTRSGDTWSGDTWSGDTGAADVDEVAPQTSASETNATEFGGLEATDPGVGDAGPRDPGTDASDVTAREPAHGHSQEQDRVRGHDQATSKDAETHPDMTSDHPSAGITVGGDVPVGSNSPGAGDTGEGRTSEAEAASGRGASWVPGSGDSGPASGAPSQPEVSVSPDAATLAAIAPHAIVPNPRQPRGVFDPDELDGLATSLADLGMLQPLVVRPVGGGRYELVAGERRLRAAVLAGMDTVPAVVRHTDDADLLKEALVENIHRVQLNPLEEAAAYEQLLEEFGVTQEELAARLGRSRPSISNAIRLLQLPAGVQRRVAAGVLSAGHAKALLALEDADAQSRLAERIVAEGLSVRATEELVRLRLIDEPTRPGSRSRETEVPGLLELQDDLAAALQTRVRIAMGARKGKLTVEFGSVEDLERIVGVIAAGLGTPVEGGIGNGASVGGEVAGRSAPEAAEPDESSLDARIEAATSWTPLDPGPDQERPEA